MNTCCMRKGFTLVELAIVLVIVGLLAGGILVGQSLVKSAEIRSFITQINKYSTATITFRDQYQSLPGDLGNAAQIWGAADGSTGSTAACATALGTGTQTCNGDSSGKLNNVTSSKEKMRFWQHLSLAGLIDGKFSGVDGPLGSDDVIAGVNVPVAEYGGPIAVISAWSTGTITSSTWWFPGEYGTATLLLGGDTNGGNWNGDSPILFPEDAWNIDTKMDDGKPGTGKVSTMLASRRSNCATSDDTATAVYAVAYQSGRTCVLLIPSGI